MPLIKAQLKAEIEGIFISQLSDPMIVGLKIATAYANYCKAGMAAPGLPLFTGAEAQLMSATLGGALSGNGGAPVVANAFSTAIQAFWLAPPVIFVGGPAAGVTTAMPGAAAVIGPISGGLANTKNSEGTIADIIASALDTATKTVLVTFSTPPPPAGPPPPATVM